MALNLDTRQYSSVAVETRTIVNDECTHTHTHTHMLQNTSLTIWFYNALLNVPNTHVKVAGCHNLQKKMLWTGTCFWHNINQKSTKKFKLSSNRGLGDGDSLYLYKAEKCAAIGQSRQTSVDVCTQLCLQIEHTSCKQLLVQDRQTCQAHVYVLQYILLFLISHGLYNQVVVPDSLKNSCREL